MAAVVPSVLGFREGASMSCLFRRGATGGVGCRVPFRERLHALKFVDGGRRIGSPSEMVPWELSRYAPRALVSSSSDMTTTVEGSP